MAVKEDNATKLKIGTTSCNLLVTSSVRLDKNSMTANIIEMGANTINFTPSENSCIYLDEDSTQKANILLNNKSASCINEHNRLYQLRHIRSKFHCLSTYTMCRSFGSTASSLMFRPYSIWTLCEYDSPQKN